MQEPANLPEQRDCGLAFSLVRANDAEPMAEPSTLSTTQTLTLFLTLILSLTAADARWLGSSTRTASSSVRCVVRR